MTRPREALRSNWLGGASGVIGHELIVPGVVLPLALLAICVLSGARRKPGGVIFHPLISW